MTSAVIRNRQCAGTPKRHCDVKRQLCIQWSDIITVYKTAVTDINISSGVCSHAERLVLLVLETNRTYTTPYCVYESSQMIKIMKFVCITTVLVLFAQHSVVALASSLTSRVMMAHMRK